jgi:hypothetical protein
MRFLNSFFIKLILGISFICPDQTVLANAAQPGVWNAGGAVFVMLYPEDSAVFRKIQMKKESIFIQLYNGFSVVKGEYLFSNTTNKELSFKMGYPTNGIYNGGDVLVNQVRVDSLSNFKIKADGQWLTVERRNIDKSDYFILFENSWHVWEMSFKPGETRQVEVYFIVNTNNAKLVSGYKQSRKNAFIYLLESGSVWRQPIDSARFYIQFLNGLTTGDVNGISKGFDLKISDINQLLVGFKTNLSPTPKDNLVIVYGNKSLYFDFGTVVLNQKNLFEKIERFSSLPFETLTYAAFTPPALAIGEKDTINGLDNALEYFVLCAPLLIGLLSLLIFMWALFYWRRIKKQ